MEFTLGFYDLPFVGAWTGSCSSPPTLSYSVSYQRFVTKGTDSAVPPLAGPAFPGSEAGYCAAKLITSALITHPLGSECEPLFPEQRNLCLESGIVKEQL